LFKICQQWAAVIKSVSRHFRGEVHKFYENKLLSSLIFLQSWTNIRAETCREYRSYTIKYLSIVAKQKVLLFTVHMTRNRMQNPIIKIIFS
jgi:hypothetical protein